MVKYVKKYNPFVEPKVRLKCNLCAAKFMRSIAMDFISLYITTKLKWKSFTKVIERTSKEAWVWIDRVSN
jgi:hypothetical protein